MFHKSAPQARRQRPAHHVPVECFNKPVIVQINVCTKDRLPVLASESGHCLCCEVWRLADFWRVGQYMIMPDHIHLFCTPGRYPATSLKQWVEYWKSRVASQWVHTNTENRSPQPFKLWQRDYWDTQMRSREHYEEKLSYVRLNPVRKGLVASADDWPYQGRLHDICWF